MKFSICLHRTDDGKGWPEGYTIRLYDNATYCIGEAEVANRLKEMLEDGAYQHTIATIKCELEVINF
jgi:hypothetical protein